MNDEVLVAWKHQVRAPAPLSATERELSILDSSVMGGTWKEWLEMEKKERKKASVDRFLTFKRQSSLAKKVANCALIVWMGAKKIQKAKKIRSRRACVHFQPLHQSLNSLLYPLPCILLLYPFHSSLNVLFTRAGHRHTDAWRPLTGTHCAVHPSSSLIRSRSIALILLVCRVRCHGSLFRGTTPLGSLSQMEPTINFCYLPACMNGASQLGNKSWVV